MKTFDESAWSEKCGSLANQEIARCGHVYELYQRRLSAAIDELLANLPEAHRPQAIEIAREFDYLTPEEVAEELRRDQEAGYCCHGMHPDYCPLGCGSLAGGFDDDDVTSDPPFSELELACDDAEFDEAGLDDSNEVCCSGLRHIVDAHPSLTEVAAKTGESRERPHKAILAWGSPMLRTLKRAVKATGITFGRA